MRTPSKTKQNIQLLARPQKATKITRVLHCLGCGNRTNFQHAANELYDKHLNTTISDIRKLNIRVVDKWIKVKGFEGESVTCKEYWVEPSADNLQQVYALLRLWKWCEPSGYG